MRAAFFGSPAFAVPCLEAVHEIAELCAVFSQPDRPAGRGLKVRPPAVKVRALELGLPVFQPKKVRNGELEKQLRELELDVAVVVAYGRILPKGVLDAPRMGCVNVHASLLPRWRGAAPIHWAIASGDSKTGVSLMQMDEGMDTGPVFSMVEREITTMDTTASLTPILSNLGADALRSDLPKIVSGELLSTPQPEGETHARLLTKEDGLLNFEQPALALHAHMRGMTPWPGAYTFVDGVRMKVHEATPTRGPAQGAPGEVVGVDDRGILVACSEGQLAIQSLQPEGRKRLSADDYLTGYGRPARLGSL